MTKIKLLLKKILTREKRQKRRFLAKFTYRHTLTVYIFTSNYLASVDFLYINENIAKTLNITFDKNQTSLTEDTDARKTSKTSFSR